ncbi:HipA domain-containing protein [Ottowia thiooxydans]|uniref:Serine/threonine-protein kinase HipA n=1 Tax=Ottowia thiooxydans TaxID=219182 RepID=A0ABV2Q9H1_9BURK
MSKPPLSRALIVYSNGDRVGVLLDQDNIWKFSYDPGWVARPDAFALTPSLSLGNLDIIDGSSERPVQWFFDNLLPEERLREVVAKEAGIRAPEDAFALLSYLGRESAGSLTLLPYGEPIERGRQLEELSDGELSARIRNLPRSSLVNHQRKRMSLAGAQHKMLAVIKYEQAPHLYQHLYEPVGGAASTHILKPNHPDVADYPASVMNEYVTMRLAEAAKLQVPSVEIRYVPEPVYCIKRFDRAYSMTAMERAPRLESAEVTRLHVLDGCQLLNIPSVMKYSSASLDTLIRLIEHCRNKASTRTALFRWLVFNMAVGNNDNHLKNLSFFVNHTGIELAPHYDLLCTLAYETKALAETSHLSDWSDRPLVFPLPGAERFSQVTRSRVIEGGVKLGLGRGMAGRILDETRVRVHKAVPDLLGENALHLKGNPQHLRVARAMGQIVIGEMLERLK